MQDWLALVSPVFPPRCKAVILSKDLISDQLADRLPPVAVIPRSIDSRLMITACFAVPSSASSNFSQEFPVFLTRIHSLQDLGRGVTWVVVFMVIWVWVAAI